MILLKHFYHILYHAVSLIYCRFWYVVVILDLVIYIVHIFFWKVVIVLCGDFFCMILLFYHLWWFLFFFCFECGDVCVFPLPMVSFRICRFLRILSFLNKMQIFHYCVIINCRLNIVILFMMVACKMLTCFKTFCHFLENLLLLSLSFFFLNFVCKFYENFNTTCFEFFFFF